MTPVIALDLATSTGWALRDSEGKVTSGVQRFDLKRGESAGMRFLRFRAWLREAMGLARCPGAFQALADPCGHCGKLLEEHAPPGVLAYEAAHHRGGAATALCVGLATVALEEAAARGWETCSVHTATLKKHATGKGNAGKAEMCLAACERWKGHLETQRPGPDETLLMGEDEADALCVLSWALDEIGEGK